MRSTRRYPGHPPKIRDQPRGPPQRGMRKIASIAGAKGLGRPPLPELHLAPHFAAHPLLLSVRARDRAGGPPRGEKLPLLAERRHDARTDDERAVDGGPHRL